MATVLAVGDLHLPFEHPLYLRFCQDTAERFRATKIVQIGDIVDNHAIGFWQTDPQAYGAEREATLALERLEAWKAAFPRCLTCIGNHDERHFRKGFSVGLPSRYLKGYKEIYSTKTWDWKFEHEVDGCLFEHGTGASGKNAAYNRAISKRMSVIMGHTHSNGGCAYSTSERDRIFGLATGCGVDERAYSFSYGRTHPNRPCLGVGVVKSGVEGLFIPMLCGSKEKYHRSKA